MIVFVDTNVVIYAVESEPTFGVRAQTRMASALAAGDTLMISDLVRMECMVLPVRAGDVALQKQYRAYFARPEVQVVPITAAVCDRAVGWRANCGETSKWRTTQTSTSVRRLSMR